MSNRENYNEEKKSEDITTTTTTTIPLSTTHPLVSASLAYEVLSSATGKHQYVNGKKPTAGKLGSRVLYEAYANDDDDDGNNNFSRTLDAMTSSVERFAKLKLSDDASNR